VLSVVSVQTDTYHKGQCIPMICRTPRGLVAFFFVSRLFTFLQIGNRETLHTNSQNFSCVQYLPSSIHRETIHNLFRNIDKGRERRFSKHPFGSHTKSFTCFNLSLFLVFWEVLDVVGRMQNVAGLLLYRGELVDRRVHNTYL